MGKKGRKKSVVAVVRGVVENLSQITYTAEDYFFKTQLPPFVVWQFFEVLFQSKLIAPGTQTINISSNKPNVKKVILFEPSPFSCSHVLKRIILKK